MREKIIRTCIALFNQRGCRFTLDDITEALKISRKTFYKYFLSKEEALMALIDEMHGAVYPQQCAVLADPSLTTVQKLSCSLTLRLPYEDEIDLARIYEVEQYYPDVYAHFMETYEKGWEITEELLRRGMDEGSIRRENVELVRLLLENGMRMLYQGDFLRRTGLAYHDALEQTVAIILRGIEQKGEPVC